MVDLTTTDCAKLFRCVDGIFDFALMSQSYVGDERERLKVLSKTHGSHIAVAAQNFSGSSRHKMLISSLNVMNIFNFLRHTISKSCRDGKIQVLTLISKPYLKIREPT